ncbi:DUF808 domain-containing protein [Lysobacter sp. GX 14042]|uniref:DUF808 domain-containing protein n=1 Tax=Lysobacter sp. GX 14042 TaxID=2907155 RepID=UPI001F3F9E46|nr:DUF808 domain-containing protein [Lysobacter sp. GX 14042]MCE7032713.1 DUF808 domain-containing protein [Lysobacter sp. GX 14042]
MAGASLFTLLDDIATLLDDVSILAKVAAKKTAGVLGDDLALNAQQVTGVTAARELPVVAAVAKGALVNKTILVPGALAISAWLPWLITPLMMAGGAFLCYEGVEKLAHRFLHSKEEDAQRHAERVQALADGNVDPVAFERRKVKGAIRTDFILSAEIIVLTLGVVAGQAVMQQLIVLALVAVGMVVVVYGLVGGIVKLDDLGLLLCRRGGVLAPVGGWLVTATPWLMRGLSIAGTAAMFLVGGGILVHSIPAVHHFILSFVPAGAVDWLVENLANAVFGILAGLAVLLVVQGIKHVRGKTPATT